jgi:hypothetical protein
MLDLKNMTDEELNNLKAQINEELLCREKKEVVYTHNCKTASTYHLQKYKHWAKLVTGVDTSKTNGYAFKGTFLAVTQEHKVPIGSIIVEVCEVVITAYRMELNGKKELFSGRTHTMSKFIEKVAELI